jgi:O-antigen/teichoic acid export membrane protein
MALVGGILLVPLYLRHIPSDLYGAWQASGNILTWVTMLDPGLSAVLQQRVAEAYGAGDTKAVSGWIASGLWITAGIVLLVLFAGMVSSLFLGSWMNLPPGLDHNALGRAFRWSVAGSSLLILSFSVTAANQGLQSSMGIGLIFVGATVVRLVLVVVLITSGFGLLAIAIPSVAMGLLLLVGNLGYMHARLRRDNIAFSWAPTRLRALGGLLSFSSLGRGAGVVANNIDLFLVARFLGPESVNTLRFTRTAPEMSRLLLERPVAAVQPSLSHLLGSGGTDRARELLLRLLRLAFWLLGLLTGGFVVFNCDFLRLWVGERFYAGTPANLLLIAAFGTSVTTSMLSSLCFAAGDIRGTSFASLAQAVVYVPLLWLGGRWFGIPGLVAASFLSVALTQGWYMPRAFFRIYRVTKGERVRLLLSVVPAGFASAAAASLFRHTHPAGWFLFVAWVAAFTASYGLLLLLFSSAARAELRHGWRWFRWRLSR